MRKIVTDVEKLSQSCIELDIEKDRSKIIEIVTDIKAVMKRNNLVALSAPQIGYNYRIFCIRFSGVGKKIQEQVITYINPMTSGSKDITLNREEDPCFPGKEFIMPRSEAINLMYQTDTGAPVTMRFNGKVAMLMQLMVDHLDGVLVTDIGLEIDKKFDKASEEEKNQVLEAYLKSLKEYQDQILNEIEDNAELKKMKDAIDFIQSVRSGETKIVENKDKIEGNS